MRRNSTELKITVVYCVENFAKKSWMPSVSDLSGHALNWNEVSV